MKNLINCFILIFSVSLTAQVGIGNTDPDAMLDVASSNQATPSNTDGILIPKIDQFPATNPTVLQDGMLVFVTGLGSVVKGFYYWDNTTTTWVVIGGFTGADNQNLTAATLSGTNLTISIENGMPQTVNLASLVNDADFVIGNEYNSAFGLSGTNLVLTDGGGARTVNLNSLVNDADFVIGNEYNTELSLSGRNLSITDGGGARNVDLTSLVNDADFVLGNEYNTAFNLSGTNLTITDGGGGRLVNLASLINDADFVLGNEYNTAFNLSGTNLTLTDGGGARTVSLASLSTNINAENGLGLTGGIVRIGGALTQNTTITQNEFDFRFSLTGLGDYHIDNGAQNLHTVSSSAQHYYGGEFYWRDEDTFGTNLATLQDDGDDGRFIIYENGITSIDLDANSQFIFNEQGLDRNFRVESNNNANMLFLDAGNDRVGIGVAVPTEALHVLGGARVTTGAVIGTYNSFGNHLLTAASTSPSIQLGSMAFNQLEAGRLTFEEQVPNFPTVGGIYCGFQIYHNGSIDKLSFRSGCSTNDNRMTLERGGDFGIATDNPTALLSVNGIANKTGGGAWAVFSDKRLKKNITNYDEGLDLIMKVKPINFSYNKKYTDLFGKGDGTSTTRVFQGVIAQELQIIAPDMVNIVNKDDSNSDDLDGGSPAPEGGEFLEVDPSKFTYALINSVQQQQKQIEAQQKEINELKVMVKQLLNKD